MRTFKCKKCNNTWEYPGCPCEVKKCKFCSAPRMYVEDVTKQLIVKNPLTT